MRVCDMYINGFFSTDSGITIYPDEVIQKANVLYADKSPYGAYELERIRKNYLKHAELCKSQRREIPSYIAHLLDEYHTQDDLWHKTVLPKAKKEWLAKIRPGDVWIAAVTLIQEDAFDAIINHLNLRSYLVGQTSHAANVNYPSRTNGPMERNNKMVLFHFPEGFVNE